MPGLWDWVTENLGKNSEVVSELTETFKLLGETIDIVKESLVICLKRLVLIVV